MTLRVKVTFGTDIRIWRQKNRTHENLMKFVQSSFPQISEDFILRYEDDEGDFVTIAADDDLEEALDLYESLEEKSIKIYLKLRKEAHKQFEEPGAISEENTGSETVGSTHAKPAVVSPPHKEIVSEPGLLGVEEKEDEMAYQTKQVEGSSSKQSLFYWIRNLLPLLCEHGIADEIKNNLSELYNGLDAGDDLATALQTAIARCHLLQEQKIIQEFMTHLQTNISALSDDIVPHLLRLTLVGAREMLDKFTVVANNWKRTDVKFDVAPFLRKVYPNYLNQFRENDESCQLELLLRVGKMPELHCIKKFSREFFGDTEKTQYRLMPTGNDEWNMAGHNFDTSSGWRNNRRRGGGGPWRHSAPRRSGNRGTHGPPGMPHHTDLPPYDPWFPHNKSYSSGGYSMHEQFGHSSISMNSSPSYGYSHDERDVYSGPSPRQSLSHRNSWQKNSSVRRARFSDFTQNHNHNHNHIPHRGSEQRSQDSGSSKKTVRTSATPLKAEFVDHVNIPLRSKYLGGQKLLKKWCVRNVGSEDWNDVTLVFTKGHGTLPTQKSFPVPFCPSGELCELSAMIQTPMKPDRYTSYFRLNRGTTNFGPRIWVDVHVVATEEELAEADEQTKKRLERIESRASQTRNSAQRNSARRSQNKNSTRDATRRKKKNNAEDISSGIGLVEVPLSANFRQNSGLNKNAQEFRPKQPLSHPGEYHEQVREIEAIMCDDGKTHLIYELLDTHKGDVNKVIEVLLTLQSQGSV